MTVVTDRSVGAGRHTTIGGVWSVALAELGRRIVSRGSIGLFAAWFVVLGAVTLTARSARGVTLGAEASPEQRAESGGTLVGIVVCAVLILGLAVVPALTATSFTGARGSLALRPPASARTSTEVVLGTFLAAWAASLVLLAGSAPALVWANAVGGLGAGPLLAMFGLLAALFGVLCAIGLGCSAVSGESAYALALAYAIVAALTVVSPMAFLFALVSTEQLTDVRVWTVLDSAEPADPGGATAPAAACGWIVRPDEDVFPPGPTWLLAAPNPFVIVADVSPSGATATGALAQMRDAVRAARDGDPTEVDSCPAPYATEPSPVAVRGAGAPVWPWGLGADVALGAGALALANRRLARR